MNVALLPDPFSQFFDNDGAVLAGGKLFSYAAGSTTPQATYTDSTGTSANTNPVILDSSGRASVWLAGLTYKLVLQDASGVQIWSQDGVSSVSLAQLQANDSFASITVSGDATIGGNLTVDGTITAASGEYTGTLTVDGNLTAASAAVTGNASVGGTLTIATSAVTGDETVGGDFTVTGATALNGDVQIGGVELPDYITALIPALTAIAGNLIITNISTSGGWVIFTFGAGAGTLIKIAIGAGQGGNGYTITPPSGFDTTNFLAMAAFATVSATPGNELLNIATSISVATITVTASDTEGHNFDATASWVAVAWLTGGS
jgi:cytoskeletal protein CcmA (bactofilin family)